MSDENPVVLAAERRYDEGIDLSRRVNDWRVPVVALAFSALLAGAGLLALHDWWGWMIVAGLIAAVVALTVRARRELRELERQIVDFRPFPIAVTDADRVLLTKKPAYRLEPVLALGADQLERMLRPTKQDTATQTREIPGQLVAIVLYAILTLGGIVVTFLIPTIVIVGDSTISRELWPIILFLAGVPLMALTTHFLLVVDVTRTAVDDVVAHVEAELPRVWLAGARHTSGGVIVASDDAYSIDRTKLPIKPQSRTTRLFVRYGVLALFVLLSLIALLDEVSSLAHSDL
jgi:MFS family permease